MCIYTKLSSCFFQKLWLIIACVSTLSHSNTCREVLQKVTCHWGNSMIGVEGSSLALTGGRQWWMRARARAREREKGKERLNNTYKNSPLKTFWKRSITSTACFTAYTQRSVRTLKLSGFYIEQDYTNTFMQGYSLILPSCPSPTSPLDGA